MAANSSEDELDFDSWDKELKDLLKPAMKPGKRIPSH